LRLSFSVVWGDDIGWQNVSAYDLGTMGYTTPNIDRFGMGGIRFTDHYAQPSCTRPAISARAISAWRASTSVGMKNNVGYTG
jgi:arylsulfatase A-like enzyme